MSMVGAAGPAEGIRAVAAAMRICAACSGQ